ncbi:MAG TPA: methionine ABC transporter substrate-binding protein [Firmicutes bacterium]|nr:methionine ABC transporter substrate-binding protein [Bacillota bacterium]
MKKILMFTMVFLLMTGVFSGNGISQAATNNQVQVVKLGITGDDHRIWDLVKAKLIKENIDLEIISFSDYVRPNIALAEKEIDLNAFQHYVYLNKFKSDHNLKIVAIGQTILAPMGIYSGKLKSLKDLKDGGKVAVMNDAANEGRALNLLQSVGLIKLRDGAGLLPTLKDIVANPKKLEIIELAAPQLPRALPDVDLSTINSGIAIDAKLSPLKDSLFLEKATLESSKPYINIIAAREEDKDNPLYKKVVRAYQSKDIKKAIQEIYQGAQIAAFK